MCFKPYSVFVGYDNRITDYQQGKRGKIPNAAVLEWLHENIGQNRWQFDWEPPTDAVIKNVDNRSVIDHVNDVANQYSSSGATFYFDSEEDRLLFCMKWLSGKAEPPLFWHPV